MKLLLFSGGVDSTCIAWWKRPDILLTVDYGQKCARGEVRTASYLAQKLRIHHTVLRVDIGHLGAGDLAGSKPVAGSKVPETWPLRNQFLVTVAVMRFAREGVREFQIGTLFTDNAHPDGGIDFIERLSSLVRLQEPAVTVTAPAIEFDSLRLVHTSGVGEDILGWTFSCHVANVSCGICRGCNKSLELFQRLEHFPV